ncbi:hypothetical protein ADUPG1_003526, partial [Aduncisulcus paluster]
QDEPKDIDTFTRVTFEQLALVLETMEDAKGHLNPYQSRSSTSTSKGTSGSYESRTTEARKKFHERTRRNSTGSFNSEIVCFNCGQKGHIASKCPNPKKTSDKRRYSMKAVSTSKPEAPYFTCNVWVKGFKEGREMKVLVDTGSDVNIIAEQKWRSLPHCEDSVTKHMDLAL